jgi:hypothetical protein
LTAADSKGLSTSKTVVINPQTVNLTISSVPAGAPVVYAGYPLVAAPHQARTSIGFRTSISAAEQFVANGRVWQFASWSDGGAIAHDVTIGDTDTNFVAGYRDAGPAAFAPAGDFGPGPDKVAPRITFSGLKRRRLRGSVTDTSAVKSLFVALRSRRHGRCRWWSAKAGRLSRKSTRCSKPRFMKAVLKPAGAGRWSWSVRLRGKLGKGRYKLLFRATDGASNVATSLAGGRSSLRVKP